MKKYILSIVILSFLFACNETSPPVETQLPILPDSIKKDTVKTAGQDKSMGTGLTLEEMTDDSVFIDGSVPTGWDVAGITDVKSFKLFLKRLQILVFNDDKEKLAQLIKYPLGKSIKTEKDFINNYNKLFSKDVKLSIAKINFSQVFRNSKGAMSEDGRVWFGQDGEKFKIIAINN
ncbi:MAG: hypothetical protein ABIN01_07145 [Ferruginibacter sp.]